jgi:hypothetical protein
VAGPETSLSAGSGYLLPAFSVQALPNSLSVFGTFRILIVIAATGNPVK